MSRIQLSMDYLVPKISAEKAKLLSMDELYNLIKQKTIEEFLAKLRNTKYKEVILKHKPITDEEIEYIIKEYLILTYIKFLKTSPPSIRDYLLQKFLKFEIENIKKLVRLKIQDFPYSEIRNLIHMTPEKYLGREDLFNRLMHAGSLLELIHMINFEFYSDPLEEALHVFQEDKSVYLFDVLLDLKYFENNLDQSTKLNSKDQKFVQKALALEYDIYNILTIFRSKELELKPHQIYRLIFIDERINSEEFYENIITSKEFKGSLNILENAYNEISSEEINNISELKNFFQEKRLNFYLTTSKERDFNINYLISIIALLEIEKDNLFKILYGIEYKINPNAIKNNLIVSKGNFK
ncbi:MAG: hypothetical protein GF329_17565 [Candidatus Lokiarchaeota archaeon]|nr:hypothetical protein [Candidatus Lokiarchaeota archaeon]